MVVVVGGGGGSGGDPRHPPVGSSANWIPISALPDPGVCRGGGGGGGLW